MISVLIPDMPKANDLLPYLHQIDLNRQYTNFGPLNQELESRLEAYIASQSTIDEKLYITTVANATLGLESVFSLLGLSVDAKVLVPALTFPATATAILRHKLTPLFSDVDPHSWLMTPEIARSAVAQGHRIDLVVPVAAFGVPQDVLGWDLFTEETGIPVVIDAAGAFSNQTVGKKTHVIFSLHATKSLGGGEGGFIATRDVELCNKIRIFSNFGLEKQGGEIAISGTNAKLSEYHAAVALASLDTWEVRQALRKKLLHYWLERLLPLRESAQIITQYTMEQYAHSLLPLRFKNTHCMTALADYLLDKKIQTRRWYYPLLPNHPCFSSYPLASDISIAQQLSQELLGLPFHIHLQLTEIDYITDVLIKWLSGNNHKDGSS